MSWSVSSLGWRVEGELEGDLAELEVVWVSSRVSWVSWRVKGELEGELEVSWRVNWRVGG